MKKVLFSCAIMIACMMQVQTASAQFSLKNLMNALGNSDKSEQQTTETTSDDNQSSSSSNVLGNILNGVASNAGGSSSSTGNMISNLISSLTGDLTTTAETVVGTWSYTGALVQFESENALSNAGGTVVAEKVEEKLDGIYSKVGIKDGSFTFTFNSDGTCSYSLGSRTLESTYTFDNEEKAIMLKTKVGREIKIYTTVSGNTMGLSLDASKLLTLVTAVSSRVSALSTVSAIADQYTGMKLGFELEKQ